MVFYYFLNIQAKHLMHRMDDIQKTLTPSNIAVNLTLLNVAISNASNAHDLYLHHTSNSIGFFKSFVPGTNAYNARRNCAIFFEGARFMLNRLHPR